MDEKFDFQPCHGRNICDITVTASRLRLPLSASVLASSRTLRRPRHGGFRRDPAEGAGAAREREPRAKRGRELNKLCALTGALTLDHLSKDAELARALALSASQRR
jgi:hypothetical protein